MLSDRKTAASYPIVPMEHVLDDVREVTGTGTIFPDDAGNPILHLHMACGRHSSTVTGCIRQGVKVWHVMEAILFELTDTQGAPPARCPDGIQAAHSLNLIRKIYRQVFASACRPMFPENAVRHKGKPQCSNNNGCIFYNQIRFYQSFL